VAEALNYPALGSGDPLSFAHRGGAALWPENTLEAFAGAAALGCTHLETDLRMTRDGAIVLMHDADVSRTTDGKGTVSDFSLEEIQRLDAAYWFSPDGQTYPRRGQGLRVPTLAELTERLPNVGINVEIKERGTADLPAALWATIQERGLEDRLIVAAERHGLLARFRRISRGRMATAASRRECLQFWLASRLSLERWLSVPYCALQIPVVAAGLQFLTPRLIRAAHALGIAVHVWTIDDPVEMRALLDSGVNGLMSDRPDRLMAVVQGPDSGDTGG
jgi:glycerophosphoryl diester phosphodiesterase